MSRTSSISHRLALSLIGLAATAGIARADITTALQTAVANPDGTYAYTYQVSLSNNSQLDATTSGSPIQFGTVYDFGAVLGGLSGIAAQAGSILANSFSFSLADAFTPAALTAPVDQAGLLNIRFTYTSSTGYATAPSGSDETFGIIQPGDANLGTFTVQSAYATAVTSVTSYDGQSYKSTDNTQQSNVGLVQVPIQPSTSVPEPASLALLGAGLLAARIARRRGI